MSTFKKTLKCSLDAAHIPYHEEQIDQCEQYYKLVVLANKQTNLTRILGEADAANMHFFGALQLLSFVQLPQACRVIDIGTGAGFPGVPLKILRPDIDLTLLDSAGKKIDFVRQATQAMGIDATVLNTRAEDAANEELRESYDVVVSRAVAALPMLLELCVPFLKVGGIFATWKGVRYQEEIGDAKTALQQLGCMIKDCFTVGEGAIILTQKQKPTQDIYPRRFSKIKSNPL